MKSRSLISITISNAISNAISNRAIVYFSFFLAIFILFAGESLQAQYDKYSGYDKYNASTRIGVFYAAASSIFVEGKGFRDVQISDHEATPNNPNDVKRIDLNPSPANYQDFIGGIALGFVTMGSDQWGFGGEFEFFGFDNPSIIQYAAFINYGLYSNISGNLIIGPYAKIGYTSLSVELAKARTNETVRLSNVERLRARDAVDVSDGDTFSAKSEAIYVQFGLHFLYRLKKNFSAFLQIGVQNEINKSKELSLQVEGSRENPVTKRRERGDFSIDFDDRAIVESGTNDPARLDPDITTGPYYFSLGLGYTFDF